MGDCGDIYRLASARAGAARPPVAKKLEAQNVSRREARSCARSGAGAIAAPERWHKPAGFRCKRTTYAEDDLTDHEDDSVDSDVGGSAAVG